MRKLSLLLLTLFAAAVPCAWLSAEPPKPADDKKPAAADEFGRDVLPFLEKHCVACHNPEKRRGELILSTFREESSVPKNRTVWQAVTKMVSSGEMPPKGKPRPDTAAVERFDKAVAAILDRADRIPKRDPGHAPLRRLNRVEYNNTIRDLTGIDFQPAEDFPSDDIGYGFDNIGDVLSLSPVLMERYFTAAESVVQRAVLLEAPRPP